MPGVTQLIELFERIGLTRHTFEFRPFTRLQQLQYLLATQQIDAGFFWK